MDSNFIFDWIFVKLAGNKDSHKISDEFDFSQIKLFTLELFALQQ